LRPISSNNNDSDNYSDDGYEDEGFEDDTGDVKEVKKVKQALTRENNLTVKMAMKGVKGPSPLQPSPIR
jgi:hypothetical protein